MAYDCFKSITKAIDASCTKAPVKGLEIEAWIWARTEITATFDTTNPSKITALSPVGSAVAYKFKGHRKNFDVGMDRVVGDVTPDGFKHFFSLYGFEISSEDIENLDGLKDVVVVVERKQKETNDDGTFICFGAKTGLYPSSDTLRLNSDPGVRAIELTTLDQEEEPFSMYSVVIAGGTRAALEALITK